MEIHEKIFVRRWAWKLSLVFVVTAFVVSLFQPGITQDEDDDFMPFVFTPDVQGKMSLKISF